MAIKHLLVDFDGVIRHWPNDDKALEDKYGLPSDSISKVAFSKELLVPAIRGIVPDAIWRQNISSKLAQEYPQSRAEIAITEWSRNPGVIDTKILELVGSYPGVDLSLVTNATSRLESDLLIHGIVDAFENIFSSGDMGKIKPEPQFFFHVLERLSSNPGETVFVDDSIENVEIAQHLGIVVHQFVNIELLKSFLAKTLG